MANIMLTETCNFRCPYCFADEFVNREPVDITLENFRKALDFVMSARPFSGRVGLIGGEPTLHRQFRDILQILQAEDRVTNAVIFTNGTHIDETFDITREAKFHFLINLNSPADIGEKNFGTIRENTERLIRELGKRSHVTVGLNLYKPDLDTRFFTDFLKEFDVPIARLSITVPNRSSVFGFDRFFEMKQLAYDVYLQLLSDGREVVFDCNTPPACVWTEQELKKISLIQANPHYARTGFSLDCSSCKPVIDILPDLTAVRCFGLSEITRQSIADYRDINQLRTYYLRKTDTALVKTPARSECVSCPLFRKKKCYGGCLGNQRAF